MQCASFRYCYPRRIPCRFFLHKKDLEEEILYMADNYTNFLYEELLHVSSYIISKISRVVVDIERFPNEEDEPMSKVGMSALYTHTSKGAILRNISKENKIALEKIYQEYHDSFTRLVTSSLTVNDKAIIIDCHSFPSIPRVYEPKQEQVRPDICIGVDEYHTPHELVTILKNNFEILGFTVEINTPFSGSIVPLSFYKKDKRVISVMVEVNRKVYMNEETFQKAKNFSKVSKDISRCIVVSLNQFIK